MPKINASRKPILPDRASVKKQFPISNIKAIILSSLLLMPIQLLGQANSLDLMIQKERATVEERISTHYAIAIAIAGASIGAGIYFGLRQSRGSK